AEGHRRGRVTARRRVPNARATRAIPAARRLPQQRQRRARGLECGILEYREEVALASPCRGPMTWSIVAHDPATGALAVAVTTCASAVGASCPYLRSGVGAVCTQSLTTRYLGPAILDRLARGATPAAAIEQALAADAGRHLRQVHAVDRLGRSA